MYLAQPPLTRAIYALSRDVLRSRTQARGRFERYRVPVSVFERPEALQDPLRSSTHMFAFGSFSFYSSLSLLRDVLLVFRGFHSKLNIMRRPPRGLGPRFGWFFMLFHAPFISNWTGCPSAEVAAKTLAYDDASIQYSGSWQIDAVDLDGEGTSRFSARTTHDALASLTVDFEGDFRPSNSHIHINSEEQEQAR